jgi:hypothetical protein
LTCTYVSRFERSEYELNHDVPDVYIQCAVQWRLLLEDKISLFHHNQKGGLLVTRGGNVSPTGFEIDRVKLNSLSLSRSDGDLLYIGAVDNNVSST